MCCIWREIVCDRCYSRNGHRTAMSRTAFRAFVTVVAALFQELGGCCHAIIAMRCISSVCDCYSRNMDINCHSTRWHLAFVTTLFQEMDTHCRATCCISIDGVTTNFMPHAAFSVLHFRRRGHSNPKKWASSTTMPRH